MFAIFNHLYGGIETREQKEDERREAADLARHRAEEKRAEDKRKDLERRWREFRGPGLFPRKECRDWANSTPDLPGSDEEAGGWRISYASPIFKDDSDDSPPFVSRYEDDDWKSLWEQKFLDCHDRRGA